MYSFQFSILLVITHKRTIEYKYHHHHHHHHTNIVFSFSMLLVSSSSPHTLNSILVTSASSPQSSHTLQTPLRIRQTSWIPSTISSKSVSFRRKSSGLKTLRLESKLVIAMVGLPGRGKSYTARKLARYVSHSNTHTRTPPHSNTTTDF